MTPTRLTPTATILALAGAGLLIAGASATEPVGEQFRVSSQGPDGNPAYRAATPDVAHNAEDDQYLIVWAGTIAPGENEIYGRLHDGEGAPLGDPFRISNKGIKGDGRFGDSVPTVVYNPTDDEYLVAWQRADGNGSSFDNESEIYARRLDANAAKVGDEIRVSDMGPDGDGDFDAIRPEVAYNSIDNEYLIVWHGDDDSGGLVEDELEVFAQRLTAAGAEIGGDIRVSHMDQDGDADSDARRAAVAYNPTANEYLVAWHGDDDSGALADDENEVHVQRLNGDGTEIGGDTRISQAGPDGDADFDARYADVTYNAAEDEFLVVWRGDTGAAPLVDDELEVYVQRVSAAGVEIGDDRRVSDVGPVGESNYEARGPAISYNSTTNEYLVVWRADTGVPPMVDDEVEVYAQRLDASADEIGPDDLRVSRMGPDGMHEFGAVTPGVTYNAVRNEHLVVWYGDTDAGGTVDNEVEIYARRIKGAAAPGEPPPGTPPGGGIPGTNGAPSAPNCAEVSTITGGGSSGQLTLSTTQLRINQKIGQAAVRRANAIDDWLNDGLVNDDLCGGSLVPGDLDPGVSYTQGLLEAVPSKADPRPLSIPPAQPKPGVTFELTTAQLQINQKVYSAAVRRANALKARIEGDLTGGDIRDGQLTADRLRQDLKLGALAPAAQVAAASTTNVAPAQDKNATFTLSLEQLRINQRVAQAAVKRTNELRALLGSGLKGENFADGTISAADWTP